MERSVLVAAEIEHEDEQEHEHERTTRFATGTSKAKFKPFAKFVVRARARYSGLRVN